MLDRAVLTIDLEFFEHTPAYERASGTLSERAVGYAGVEYLIRTMANADIEATFFVVGELAESYPDLIRQIVELNHEIGSHSQTHVRLSTVDTDTRFEEIARSRDVLRSVSGQSISGFRAPAFDLSDGHFSMLERAGYGYDSSVVPARAIPGWYGGDYTVQTPSTAESICSGYRGRISELPVSVMPWLRLPLSGAWLRFFGTTYTIFGMRRLVSHGITPVLYVHPWEFVDLPSLAGVPKRVYFRTGDWMCKAFKRILREPFEFTTAGSELERHESS